MHNATTEPLIHHSSSLRDQDQRPTSTKIVGHLLGQKSPKNNRIAHLITINQSLSTLRSHLLDPYEHDQYTATIFEAVTKSVKVRVAKWLQDEGRSWIGGDIGGSESVLL